MYDVAGNSEEKAITTTYCFTVMTAGHGTTCGRLNMAIIGSEGEYSGQWFRDSVSRTYTFKSNRLTTGYDTELLYYKFIYRTEIKTVKFNGSIQTKRTILIGPT